MKKLSTHIKGLDALFHGGVQVTSVTDPTENQSVDHRLRDSLVIVIRGCRGCHKHLFAMQLMHGLGISIYDYFKKDNISLKQPAPTVENDYEFKGLQYYSINKQSHLLEDMYLDLLIERWISHTNIEYKEIQLGEGTAEQKSDKTKILNKRNLEIAKALFDWDSIKKLQYHDTLENHLTYYLSNNIIGYNARTNSLHWRDGNGTDDEDNKLVKRQTIDFDRIPDLVKRVLDEIEKFNRENNYDFNKEKYYEFDSEFLNVSFKSKDDNALVRNANSARNNFFSILHELEDLIEKDNEDTNANEKEYQHEVVVIEGFSHISEQDLQSLPYTHLLNCLRKVSRISILVFEDTQTTMPDGDIEIEIKSNFDKDEDYTYNELRVSKSVNQVAACGWHLYKRQESHIRIYPSLHLRLFKRSYINNQMHEIGRSIFEDSYDQYLDFPESTLKNIKTHTDNDNTQCEAQMEKQNCSECLKNRKLFNRAEKYKVFSLENNLDHFINDYIKDEIDGKRHQFKENENENKNKNKNYEAFCNILSGRWITEEKYYPKKSHDNNPVIPIRLHNHPPVTTIVGNPNSFKRSLALCQAFAHKKRNPDGNVLIVLLDKDSDEMRKKILCPGLVSKINSVNKETISECTNCYNKTTFLNVNPGCITPEELLSMIKDHIRVYVGNYDKFDKKRPLHIIFDDYHRIDFNFPFLSSSNLFTSALISLCQFYEVGLTILCDKNSKRVREVCTLSDYVLCVERDETDKSGFSIYLERMGDLKESTSFLRYDISGLPFDVSCDETNGLHITENLFKEKVKVANIGTMKEYWRETINFIETERPRVEKQKPCQDKDK